MFPSTGKVLRGHLPGIIYVKLRRALSICDTELAFLVINSSYIDSHCGRSMLPTDDFCALEFKEDVSGAASEYVMTWLEDEAIVEEQAIDEKGALEVCFVVGNQRFCLINSFHGAGASPALWIFNGGAMFSRGFVDAVTEGEVNWGWDLFVWSGRTRLSSCALRKGPRHVTPCRYS